MNIEINREDAGLLLVRLSAAPEDEVAERLFNAVTLALEMEPGQQFDHDPRFDEGGELHAEANPECKNCHGTGTTKGGGYVGLCEDCSGSGMVAANVPKDLARSTLWVAQNIVCRVQNQLCNPGFDKNEAMADLYRVVAMLETVMQHGPQSHRMPQGAPSEAPKGSIGYAESGGASVSDSLKRIEADGDTEEEAGFLTESEAEESNEFARRVMGIPSRECPNCGAEVSRNQRRCGDCETRL